MKKRVYPQCFDTRPNCFARCGESCTVLKQTAFPDSVCPFYKIREQADADGLRRRKRIRSLGLIPREVNEDG